MHADFPNVGEVFLGRYQIERLLGRGGFARVYRAIQLDLQRDVAIKVMRPAIDGDEVTEETTARMEQIEERFRREARVISRFRSPNTVTVYDYGRTDGGLLYMTLEFLDGRTLAALLQKSGPLDPKRAVFILRQILQSLHEAHHFDVLHRDIKPQNIMVFNHIDTQDLVKVLDFGIAKVMEGNEEEADDELTTDGTLVGTPRYMSPEQIRGGEVLTPASDLYSLGLVFYEMLCGVKAVPETTTMRIIAAHVDSRPFKLPESAQVGEGLRWILGRMVAKMTEDRFQTAREALDALDRWDPDEPVSSTLSLDVRDQPRRERLPTPTVGATLAPREVVDANEPAEDEDQKLTAIINTSDVSEAFAGEEEDPTMLQTVLPVIEELDGDAPEVEDFPAFNLPEPAAVEPSSGADEVAVPNFEQDDVAATQPQEATSPATLDALADASLEVAARAADPLHEEAVADASEGELFLAPPGPARFIIPIVVLLLLLGGAIALMTGDGEPEPVEQPVVKSAPEVAPVATVQPEPEEPPELQVEPENDPSIAALGSSDQPDAAADAGLAETSPDVGAEPETVVEEKPAPRRKKRKKRKFFSVERTK